MNRILLIALIVAGCCMKAAAQTPVEKYGQLSVKGNHIVDKNGNPVQLRGMSLYWSQWKPAFFIEVNVNITPRHRPSTIV